MYQITIALSYSTITAGLIALLALFDGNAHLAGDAAVIGVMLAGVVMYFVFGAREK